MTTNEANDGNDTHSHDDRYDQDAGANQQQQATADATPASEPQFTYEHTTNLPGLMQSVGFSLMISTYQIGKLLTISSVNNRCKLLMRTFQHPMGIAVRHDRLGLVCKNQVWHFDNRPDLFDRAGKRVEHDTYYVPRRSHVTGDIAGHEAAWGQPDLLPTGNSAQQSEPELWVVNTRFCCLATMTDSHVSFVPRWKPPFITEYAPEDRCHLNGLAMDENGYPRYVSALGHHNGAQSWRDEKKDGGCIMDVGTGEFVCRGLCMPHSPRLYAGRLWVLDSGTGRLLVVDPNTGQTDVVSHVPGFCRGLSFMGNLAFIGLSRARSTGAFGDLPILNDPDTLVCGVHAIDITTGNTAARIELRTGCAELFDVTCVPNARHVGIVGFTRDTVDGVFVLPPEALAKKQ
ncbi:MAG: TIGR03032 family protein [Planctomycetes bacterium]|nr:TIGR03032 family protein [Planctomycetota bacterium]NOG55320.1 TIGR03032 family protein [Planctomycetota bacterium]